MAQRALFIVVSALLCANGMAVAIIFALMWHNGAVKVCEPIVWVRTLEIGLAASMAILGLGSFLYAVTRKERHD